MNNRMMFVLEPNINIRSRITRFFSSRGFEVHSFSEESEMDKGFSEFGTPDVLVTEYKLKKQTSLSMIDRLRMKIKVIVCVTGFFDNEDIRLKLYLHGCVDVKPEEQLESLYNSVMMALETEPNWVVDDEHKL